MKFCSKSFLFLLVFCSVFFSSSNEGINAQDVLYSNPFGASSNGDISGVTSANSNASPLGWSAAQFGHCGLVGTNGIDYKWGVTNGAFDISAVEGLNCCQCDFEVPGTANCGDVRNVITFGPIDISNHHIYLQPNWFRYSRNAFTNMGTLGCSPASSCTGRPGSQLLVEFLIDGVAAQTLLVLGSAEFNYNSNPSCVAGFQCATGNVLTVRVSAGTHSINEYYRIENLIINGIKKTSLTAVAHNASASSLNNNNILEICEGENLTLTSEVFYNNPTSISSMQYQWIKQSGGVSSVVSPVLFGNPTFNIANASLTTSGTYELIQSDSSTACQTSSEVEVVVNPLVPGSQCLPCDPTLCQFVVTVGDWHDPNSWSCGIIPNQNCDVLIPNFATCNVAPGTAAVCNTLCVEDFAQFNMDDTSSLDAIGN